MSLDPMTPVNARREIGKDYGNTARPCAVIRLDGDYNLKHQARFLESFRFASQKEADDYFRKHSWETILATNGGVTVLVHATGNNRRVLHFAFDAHPPQTVRHDADAGAGYFALAVPLD